MRYRANMSNDAKLASGNLLTAVSDVRKVRAGRGVSHFRVSPLMSLLLLEGNVFEVY